MDRLRQDLRFALRGVRRTPGFFITAIAILALGIGMSVAMFTVFRTVLIRKLPVVDQDRIAVMWTYRSDPNVETAAGTKELASFKRDGRTIKDVAGVAHWPASANAMLDGDRSLALNRGMATGNFFDVLGVRPALGRLFQPSDDDVGDAFDATGGHSSKVLVLSYSAWKSHFGGDSSVIGRRLTEPLLHWDYRIIGVAPPGFSYPSGVEYWIPMWQDWNSGVSSIAVARLAPRASLGAARDEYLATQQRALPAANFRGAHVESFTQAILGNVTPVLTTLVAAVGLLLLIACLNVGNLLLLRASGRAREIAVRRALGAAYSDIVCQLFIEAFAFAAIGGALGLAVAVALLRAALRNGLSFVIRRAGIRLAPSAIAIETPATTTIVNISGLGTDEHDLQQRRRCGRRRPRWRAARPDASRHATPAGIASIASRTLVSCERSLTMDASTPYRPIAESSSFTSSSGQRSQHNRRRDTDGDAHAHRNDRLVFRVVARH